MDVLYGKPVAVGILAELKEKISKEKLPVRLAVILVGQNRASRIYVELKGKKAKEIGMGFSLFQFPENAREEELIEKIKSLNEDAEVNGIIVQLPLPEKVDTQKIIDGIDPQKDVDGFCPESMEKFEKGEEVFWPVFPKAIVSLIESSGENVIGKKAVAIVNSDIFGRVMKNALERKGIEAGYVLRSDLEDNIEKIKDADIVVTAVGEKNLVNGKMLKSGAIVIDGGIIEENGKVFGDVDFDSTKDLSGFISPVPGGVGPVTIACLLENVYSVYKNNRDTNLRMHTNDTKFQD